MEQNITLTKTDNGKHLRLELTLAGYLRAVRLAVKYSGPDLRDFLESKGLITAAQWRREPKVFKNDHQMLRMLLAPQLESDYTFCIGNEYAMHGSFLLLEGKHDLKSKAQADIDKFNAAPYWYDDLYAIRNIIRDLIEFAIDPRSETALYYTSRPRPVILWKGE
jgi:hypothetical protein